MGTEPFRTCRLCGQAWSDWRSFFADPQVSLVGLQAVPKIPTANVLIFNHARCGALSILTSRLRPLLGLPEPAAREAEDCEGCFRDLDDLAACQKNCVIAADRRLALEVRRRCR
jgi:hypothetical protein